jgi:hypothetical protein
VYEYLNLYCVSKKRGGLWPESLLNRQCYEDYELG